MSPTTPVKMPTVKPLDAHVRGKHDIYPVPRGGRPTHPHTQNSFRCIRKTAPADDARLKTYERSVRSSMVAIDRHEVLRWFSPSSREISRELLHGSCSTSAAMAYSLTGERTVPERPAFTCHNSCLTETLLQSWKHINVWMTSARIT
jgi:hypothetical protein